MLTILSVVCVCLVTNTVKGNTGMHENQTQSENTNIAIFTDLYTVSPDLPSWVRTTKYSLRYFYIIHVSQVFHVCCLYLGIIGSGGVFFNLFIFFLYFSNKKVNKIKHSDSWMECNF